MRNYECMMIIANNVSEDKRTALVKKFADMASKKTSVEKWGLKKFATPINYRKDGYYVLLHFEADNETVGRMTALMNITEGVERFMFIVKDEKMLAADKARKAKRAETKAAKEAAAADEVAGE